MKVFEGPEIALSYKNRLAEIGSTFTSTFAVNASTIQIT